MTVPSPIRFAPSTTGHAHPGTLLSALLCWLDARSRGARFLVRLENLDPERCKPGYEDDMLEALAWFGLDWDEVIRQNDQRMHHEAALDELAARDLLYPCSCSRARIKKLNQSAADGGFIYDNHCRTRALPPGGWRASNEPLRLRLTGDEIELHDESGFIYRQSPRREMGDPVVRRRDGSIAYHLACVIDDARAGIRRLIRGRDLLPSAPVQVVLHRQLGLTIPAYRHHFLFLETHGGKLAKFHGAVAVPELRSRFKGEELCGIVAHAAGLIDRPDMCHPEALRQTFDWKKIRSTDATLSWDGSQLTIIEGHPNSPSEPGSRDSAG